MLEYRPYTYLIGWSAHNTYYYGVEYADTIKIANPSNLWKTYFTSSKYVTEARIKFGEPDIIQIRKVFSSKQDAQMWEQRVILKSKLYLKDNFLNKGCGTIINHDDPVIKNKMKIAAQKPRSDAFKQSRSTSMVKSWQNGVFDNRPEVTNETKAKISKILKEKWSIIPHHSLNVNLSNDHKSAISNGVRSSAKFMKAVELGLTTHIGVDNGMYGKTHSSDTKKTLKEKSLNRKTIICSVCGKEATAQTIGRYHKHVTE